ncbi:phosphate ABC transporter permease PstA [Pelagicoccus sp. SDUM812005]|uniref:phosphate ABC transporter permease PstA n=1 Tax=Pelagicoccus sp. SDUM812005 TaxID=3041257 RepID=UPI00280C85B3|nr:phosphate ABC transporter permease PstA [Pelagicoccus sp. SDUM812005]MDQ8179739.1 phosphate ABC transporter permease PstA [Pelagicoccus sp. SDUM812005]
MSATATLRKERPVEGLGFHKKPSKAKSTERAVFWLFRLGTYFILLCASVIFLTIIFKGSQTVFQSSFPFVNVEFLTEAPQTLHVFEYEGEKYELSDNNFRAFEAERGVEIKTDTYAYSGGGIWPCIVGTVLLVVGAMTIALTLGVLSAIFLSEYSKPGKILNAIRLSILNLAGVPSVVFGIFGLGFFVLAGPIFSFSPFEGYDFQFWPLPIYFGFAGWNVSLLAGCFTLAFMVLPIVISASEESLRAIPQGLREASLALGASKWTAIRTNVLPYAMPGILTSSIIGVARVAGETAPIMFTAAYAMRDQLPWEGLEKWSDFFFQGVMALPYHIYVVSAKIPQNEYTERMQYGTAFVFLVIVAGIALASILLRIRMRKKYRW